jgi:hypothetical protein
MEMTYEYVCELPSGEKISEWDPSRGSPGNEGCTTEYGCPCPGTLWYIASDGVERSSEVFASIPDAFWWCTVTFTTVGYGDVNPQTPWGKVMAAITMFVGIFFLAMPLAIIGGSFNEAWDRMDARAEIIIAEKALQKKVAQDEKLKTNPMMDVKDQELLDEEDEEEEDYAFNSPTMMRLTVLGHIVAAQETLAELSQASPHPSGLFGKLTKELVTIHDELALETASPRKKAKKEVTTEKRFTNPMADSDAEGEE